MDKKDVGLGRVAEAVSENMVRRQERERKWPA